ncbi:TonB-dependent receptor domain-containing protein [Salinimicrobium soli]|uniref:TonB-dependent receptor domain-containing protein n=1 Tax=Salinimicrobium soli TaxID=1254399 RepID=UPI003AAB5EAC
MKLYNNFLVTFLVLFMAQMSFAQYGSLSGNLQDQKKETIPFATVAVVKLPDSTVVTGSTTEMDGSFNLKAPQKGDYLLRFSAIGFKSTFTDPFEVKSETYQHDFGWITMKEEVTMLNEVMVKAWRPRVEVEGGNMVVAVEGTALAAGSSAFEVISRAPGVTVGQDGNFQLNGKQGVSVMIDGRLSYLSTEELKTMLEGMSAENIRNIEIINNPSAKYDAEGTAGILNINLKKNTRGGFNGSTYAGYNYNGEHWYNAGANLNYKKGNWNSYMSFDMRKDGMIRDQVMKREITAEGENSYFNQLGEDLRRTYVPSLRIGTDYSINDDHKVGVMANLTYQVKDNEWHTWGTLQNLNTNENTGIDAWNYLEEDFSNARFNLHYTGKLDSLGTRLSADLDYVRLDENGDSRFVNHFEYSSGKSPLTEVLFSNNDSYFDIYSAKVDLSLPLNQTSALEMGVKASKVISDSQLEFFTFKNSVKELDPSRSNSFRYQENIYAAYLSYSNQLSDNWNLQAGLRAEQTVADGKAQEKIDAVSRNYLEFFPNLQIEQTVSDNYKINYSFSRRILRPDYNKLNPFIFYIDPYTYVDGNPQLRPQFTNSFQVAQTFWKKYNLLLGYDHSEDFIGEIPLQDPETKQAVFSIRNMKDFRNYSATIMAPFEIFPSWHMNNSIIMAQQEYEILIDDNVIENEDFFFTVQSTQRINLPMDLDLEIFAAYQGPLAYGLYQFEEEWWIDAGLKRSFLKDKLDVTLKATDIFKTTGSNVDSEINGNRTIINQYLGNRGISLNLRYSLSKEKTTSPVPQSELEELDRAGG